MYRLYIKLLSGLVKLKSILNLILLPPLTIFKYEKVINKKPYLYYILANLNILLCPLIYIIETEALTVPSLKRLKPIKRTLKNT